jgi:hypothetical protein
MCDLPARSRIYCSCGVIEPVASKHELPDLEFEDESIVAAILERKARMPQSLWQQWQRKNDRRAGAMLKYVGMTLPFEMTTVKMPVPPYKLLSGLPCCCYDMHTRTGLAMLRWLVHGVRGAEGIRDLLRENRVENAHKALGEALFNVEGGRICGELIYGPLCHLEQKVYAHQYSLSLDAWLHLQSLLAQALADGVIDRVREDVLDQFYGSLFAIECN